MSRPPSGNRLRSESSPYLLQHADNPVHWYPWGEEAFQEAREKNRPILLSIGYSACHWCHVMERESFEDPEIAALMNENFVNIKVDREERPDLDEIYMNAVQLLTGRGGWPLTVFLTPEGRPFYGGTYYPPEDRYGVPGFPRILRAVSQAYREKPQDVQRSVEQILGALNGLNRSQESDRPFSPEIVLHSTEQLTQAYDSEHGGLGRAPKFPNVGVFELFLRAHHKSKKPLLLEMVTHTLRKMATGGIYDHLGGGFHRYSVDERWLVPHFEKMLYDNAQLLRFYGQVFWVTGDESFKRVVVETADYLLREMMHPGGGFYSTQDADSEGEEGKFFIWKPEEVLRVLGEECGEVFCRFYDVSEVGNFEGQNILHPILNVEQAAKLFGKSTETIERYLAEGRAKLFQVREKRVKPFRDEKILVSWNGLVLSGLAEAWRVAGDARYRDAAEKTIQFISTEMVRNGLLLHSAKDGQGKFAGYLDDYAYWIVGLLDFYESVLERELLTKATDLAQAMVREFWDERDGGFFFTGNSHETLISRTKPFFDGSVPSGNSMAAQALLRLYHYTGNEDFLKRAEKIFRLFREAMEKQPFGFSHMLAALDFYLEKPKEIFLVAEKGAPDAKELIRRIGSTFLPNRTLQLVDPREPPERISPLLKGKKQIAGKPTVYLCQNLSCSLPITDWEGLKEQLGS